LVFFVNDSEYSRSTGAKPILSLSCIYLVSPGSLRAPTPPKKKRKSPASALALGHVCVGVGVVEVVLMPCCTAKRWVYTQSRRQAQHQIPISPVAYSLQLK
jgi:hypothetical protein